MLYVLVNWIFIAITCLGFGLVLINMFKKISGTYNDNNALFISIIVGLISLSTIGTVISFIYPLNSYVSFILFLISIVFIFYNKIQFYQYLKDAKLNFQSFHVLSRVGFIAIFIIALIKSTGPSELIDEGGYFLPYIRWIEEFKLTPGIGNIEDRIGFNSSFHILCALFSFHDLYSDGLYELNGFVLIVVCFYFIPGIDNLIKGNNSLPVTNFAKAICLLFLFRNSITASASDLTNVFFTELAIVLFIEKIENKTLKQPDLKFLLLILVTSILVTIKFSSSLLFILALYPLYFIFKRYRKTFLFCIFILTIAGSSWLLRSYYLSGYIVYPLYYIDLFDPDWKVSHEHTISQYYYVGEFAKTNAGRNKSIFYANNRSLSEWVPIWFGGQNTFNKITAIALLIILFWSFFFIPSNYKINKDYIYIYLVLLLCIIIWFLKFPAFRFGWAPIVVLISLILTLTMIKFNMTKLYRYAMIILFALFTTQSFIKSILENKSILANTIIVPHALPKADISEIIIPPNLKVSLSSTYECWGASPPCLPSNYDKRIRARGHKVTDGFYIEKQP